MAIAWMDGFDHYDLADIVAGKWTWQGTGISTDQPTPPAPVWDTGREGSGHSYKTDTDHANGTIRHLAKTFPTQQTIGGVGFAIKTSFYSAYSGLAPMTPARTAISGVWDGSDSISHLLLTLNNDGSLSVWRAQRYIYGGAQFYLTPILLGTAGIVPLNTWTHIGWRWLLHASAGTVVLAVNGITVLSLTGVRTLNEYASSTGYTSIVVGGSAPQDGDQGDYLGAGYQGLGSVWLDDVYALDGAAGVTALVGDAKVSRKDVTANGTVNDGTPSAGANYQCIDEEEADAADYVTLATAADIELYAVDNVAAGETVYAVQVTASAKRAVGGSASIAAEVRHSGTNYAHPVSQGLGVDASFKSFMYEADPGAASWTPTTFNAAEFGVTKST
jgi:hypothetical protein